jgi:hypothetical protein
MAKTKFEKDVVRVYEKMLDAFLNEKMDVTYCATIDILITVSEELEMDFIDVIEHLIERKKQFDGDKTWI